jgi:hypothetical protein
VEKPREATAPTWPTSLANDPYAHLRDRTYLTQKFDYFDPADTHNKVGARASGPLCRGRSPHPTVVATGQVVYEVTLEIDEDIVKDYLDWIRSGHIQGEQHSDITR